MDTKKRVLVVDDEPGILRFVSTTLKIAGFDVIVTASGEEALQLAQSQTPDIVLLDVLMQPLTGFDVLQRLRAFSQVPVIVFTA
jgi:two-component system KDP operon response regulator KdpE